MKNGKYIVVYEVCGPESCNIHYEISDNRTDWPVGLGTAIPDQNGGPFILEVGSMNSPFRKEGGNNVRIRFGKVQP